MYRYLKTLYKASLKIKNSYTKITSRPIFFALCLSALSCQNLQHKKELALDDSPKAIFIDRSRLELLSDLSYVKSELDFLDGKTEQAIEELKSAQAFTPHYLYLQERLADFYEAENLFTEAIRIYKRLEKKSHNKKRYQEKLTRAYTLNGLHERALKHHNLLNKPSSFSWRFKQAVLLDQLNQSEEALTLFQKLDFQNLSSDEKIHSLLFQSYLMAKMERPEESLKTLYPLFELECPEDSLALQVLDRFQQLKQKDLALVYIKKIEKEKGASHLTALYLLNHFLAMKDWDKAFFYAQQLEDFGKLEEAHYFYIANYLMEKTKYEKAILYLQDLSLQKPKNGYYHYLLAFTYGKNQEWEKAIAAYQKVPSQSSYFLLSQLQIAHFWKKQGDYQKSLELLDRLSHNEKVKPQVVIIYAESLWLSGAKQNALSVLAQALKEYPKSHEILALMSIYARDIEPKQHLSRNL